MCNQPKDHNINTNLLISNTNKNRNIFSQDFFGFRYTQPLCSSITWIYKINKTDINFVCRSYVFWSYRRYDSAHSKLHPCWWITVCCHFCDTNDSVSEWQVLFLGMCYRSVFSNQSHTNGWDLISDLKLRPVQTMILCFLQSTTDGDQLL